MFEWPGCWIWNSQIVCSVSALVTSWICNLVIPSFNSSAMLGNSQLVEFPTIVIPNKVVFLLLFFTHTWVI